MAAKKKHRVLIVDDDELLLELGSAVFGRDYEVSLASDGQRAWEAAKACPPDLVVTDLMMPRMHGYELCARLKGPEGVPGVKIIVTTAKRFRTDIEQALAAGADAYVVKPYDTAALLAKAAELLAGAGTDAPRAGPPPELRAAAAPGPFPAAAGKLPLSVRFWGTRGSCPTGGLGTARYGGDTACVELRLGGLVLILDCGTGLRELGLAMAREFGDRPIEGHIFVGHSHWDHIQGFPFFAPLYSQRNSFNVYGVRGAHGSLKSVFGGTMASDYFPVPLASLAARLNFVELDGPVDLGPARVSYLHLNHPGVCVGFRVDAQGRSVCYVSDHEPYVRLYGDNEVSRRNDALLADFVRGCDLLIREAQYTEQEYASRKGWGHSTFDDAVRESAAAGVKRLAVIHHDPDHSDEAMDAHLARCRELAGPGLECFAAMAGLRLEL